MKIAIIGATGRVGSALLDEALSRKHTVTAIARGATAKLQGRAGVKAIDIDAQDSNALQAAVGGHDAVFSAARFSAIRPEGIVAPVKAAGVKRLLVVGGAASLQVAPGQRLLDSPDFPAEYRGEATAGAAFLEFLKPERELEWTFLSPSALLFEGPRTGKFRIGGDNLLVDANGKSSITFADYAIAYVDELEHPTHVRQRFTVGY
jgi:putative NADH-flavin reductase